MDWRCWGTAASCLSMLAVMSGELAAIKSDAFRKAHARTGDNKPTTIGHPEFEGFHVIQEVGADGATRPVGAA